MRWILSFLVCWSASAQLPVIPYVRPSAGLTTPQMLGAHYWWVFTDPPNAGNVTNWTDRLRAATWTNTAANSPTWNSLGISFPGTSAHALFGDGTIVYTTASTTYAIIQFNSKPSFGDFLALANNGTFEWGYESGNIKNTISSSQVSFGALDTGHFVDIVLWSDGANLKCYTNGVLMGTRATATMSGLAWGRMGGDAAEGYENMYFKEMAVWSNIVLSLPQIATLHNYATNTYGFSP